MRLPLALILFLATLPAQAEPVSHPKGWGLGLMLGWPTGITAKQWLGGANAWDIGFGVGPGIRLHADYLWGLAQVLPKNAEATLDLYLGVGPALSIARGWCSYPYSPGYGCGGGSVLGGVRVPLGFDVRFKKAPVALGLELAPGLLVGADVHTLFDIFFFVRFLLDDAAKQK